MVGRLVGWSVHWLRWVFSFGRDTKEQNVKSHPCFGPCLPHSTETHPNVTGNLCPPNRHSQLVKATCVYVTLQDEVVGTEEKHSEHVGKLLKKRATWKSL